MTQNAVSPDLILVSGDFHTQDPRYPRTEAIAIGAGRILAIGDNLSVSHMATPDTVRLDIGGRVGLPGFVDIHFHYYDWAMGRSNLNLAGLPSLAELIQAVANQASKRPVDQWILGLGFNEAEWPEKRMPTRADLDRAAPDHPVFLLRCDLHLAAVNSKALKIAGIHADTPDPDKGLIERDGRGIPTGILREKAINLVKDILPELTEDEIADAMRDGLSELHSMGITGLHDIRLMGGTEGATVLKAWQKMRRSGDLHLRTWVTIPGENLDEAVAIGLTTGFGDDFLRIGHVKFFADGGMGARTAWMIEPYLDADSGVMLIPPNELEELILKADRAGLACAVHAIGDRTNRELIRIYEKLEKTRDDRKAIGSFQPALSHRIEHLQMVRPPDIQRLARLKVTVSMQPHNAILDMEMIADCVGPRAKHTYTFRDVLDEGITVCFSSDAPVCDPRPLVNIHAAVARRRRDGTPPDGWYPDQTVSVDEAVRAYTFTPAHASGAGDTLGSLVPGKRADIVVLDRNIYSIRPMEIIEANVAMTIFDGRVVYRGHSF